MQGVDSILHNRYRIERLHELGAVETTYTGWDTLSDKAVIISESKAQPNLLPDDLEILKHQFMQKTQVLCELNHPHLLPPIDRFIYDTPPYIQNDDSETEKNVPRSYIVTPALEYDSMMYRITNQGALPEKDVIKWTEQVLQALAYCHKHNVIHGDIRPHNIYISPDGDAVLGGFEVPSLWFPSDPRKWTAKRVLGTPDYAPPERWAMRVGQINARSDLYSLGATLYHALTAQKPLSAEDRIANPYSFQEIQISDSKVSIHLQNVITKSMAVSMEKRYNNAASMSADLRPSASRKLRDLRPALPSLFPPHKQKSFPLYKTAGLLLSSFVLFIAATLGMWLNTILPPVRSWFAPSTLMPSAPFTPTHMPTEPPIIAESLPASLTVPAPTNLPVTSQPTETPTYEATLPAIDQTPVISDTFDSNTYGWPLSDHQDEWGSINREVISGTYIWEIGAEQDVGRWCLPDYDSYASNFSLSVDVKRINGPANIAYGLIIRHIEGSYYVFNVRDDGYYRFSFWQGSEWISIVDWTQTFSINSGETNHLEVIARDTEFEFYINGVFVGDAVDEEINAGDNGLSAIVLSNPEIATLEFDNFILLSDNPR